MSKVAVYSFTKGDVFIEKTKEFYEILKNEFKDIVDVLERTANAHFLLDLMNNLMNQLKSNNDPEC